MQHSGKPKVMSVVERVTAFNLQTRALEEAQMGNAIGATQKLRSAVTILLVRKMRFAGLAHTLQSELIGCNRGQLSEEGKRTIKFESRKTVNSATYKLRSIRSLNGSQS